MGLIKLENITKIYKSEGIEVMALRNFSVEIEEGEIVAVVGASGSGKTTLLNIIGLLDTFDDGKYYFNGKDVGACKDAELSAIRNKDIGFVFQDYSVLPNETALFNVMLPLFFSKVELKTMKNMAIKALTDVGMTEDLFKKKTKYLSGGQKQRVAIARAIVANPSLILADEPTGALDTESSDTVLNVLTKLNNEGKTVIIVTHDMNVASRCVRKIVISDGKTEN